MAITWPRQAITVLLRDEIKICGVRCKRFTGGVFVEIFHMPHIRLGADQASISASRVSSLSASRGGLSQRKREMRGKRIANPDL